MEILQIEIKPRLRMERFQIEIKSMVRNGSLSGDGGGRCVNVGHEQHNRVRLVLAVIYAPSQHFPLPPSTASPNLAQLVRVSLEAKGGE